MKTSAICLAEYCVKGKLAEIPFRNIQVISFDLRHAEIAGTFGRYIFIERKIAPDLLHPRPIILNDAKIFAQAEFDPEIEYFLTSDSRCRIMYDHIGKQQKISFELIDIHQSVEDFKGKIPFLTEEE